MNYEIDLQVTPGSMPPVLHMSQYDTDRTYSVSLYNGGAAVTLDPDATAKVKGVNGKGVVWEIDATVIPPTGLGSDTTVIEFTLTAASTDQFGKTAATIEIDNDGPILSPLCLLFDIQKAGYTNEQAASSPEFQTAMEEAAEAAVEAAMADVAPLAVQIQAYGQSYITNKSLGDIQAAYAAHLVIFADTPDGRAQLYQVDEDAAYFLAADFSGGSMAKILYAISSNAVTRREL